MSESSIDMTNLLARIQWATIPYVNGLTYNVKKTDTQNAKQIREGAQATEKTWGNQMIGQSHNGNWTTVLGEHMVRDILTLRGENPRRPQGKGGYSPDWETDEYMYEVKTRNWTTSGTAGEKVLGTMYKYSDIPVLYEKPLRIVCVAYQEYELSNGTTQIFGDVSENKRKFLDLAKSMDVEYLKFSELVSSVACLQETPGSADDSMDIV